MDKTKDWKEQTGFFLCLRHPLSRELNPCDVSDYSSAILETRRRSSLGSALRDCFPELL